MAANPLSFELILKDKFSPTATKAGKSLETLSKTMEAFNKRTLQVAEAQDKLNTASEKALNLERQRTTQARKLAGQLEKVVKQKNRADQAMAKKVTPAPQARQGRLFDIFGTVQTGIGAGRGGAGGVMSLLAGGGSAASVALGAAFVGVTAAVAGVAAAAYSAAKAFTAMGQAAMSASRWALEGLQFRESTLATFGILLGNNGAANDFFKGAMSMAGRTPFSAQTTAQSYQKLLVGGFQKEEVPTVFQALGDLAAMNGFDENKITGTADVFAQILSKGKFVTEEYKQILNQTGLSSKTIQIELAKNMNIAVDEVEKAMQRGEIAASTGINAILKTIQKLGGGKVGNITEKQSKTMAGLLSTLRDAPMQLLFGKSDADGGMKGFGAIKGTLENLVALFQTGTKAGTEFQEKALGNLDRLWQTIFGDFTGEAGQKKLEGIILKTIDVIEVAFRYFEVGVEGVKGAAEGFMNALGFNSEAMDEDKWKKLGEDVGKAGKTIGEGIGTVVNALNSLANFFIEHPNISKALAFGALHANPVTAPAAVGSLLSGGIKKVWNRLTSLKQGEYADGPDSGFAEGGIVNTPTNALIGEAGPEAIVPLKASSGEGLSALRGMGGNISVQVSVSVDARGNADGDDISAQIARALPGALIEALEGAALEAGGAF